MDLNTAKTAGDLADAIGQLQALMAKIGAPGVRISTLRAADSEGTETNLLTAPLNDSDNAKAIAFVLSIYQAQLDGYTAQLNALS